VVHEISFAVKAGEAVALVGPSGAGKSTVVDLLARFYDPQEGRITVDGADIRDFKRSSYLGAIAIVSQDPFLFNTSIRENIRYGRAGATDAEVEEAARVAFAHDFIVEQPAGYDTVIGERGVKLSGGQRQRLTIARAVLKNAPILILDEATSALDSHSEKEVQRAMENLMRSRTTFVIAHRLSTIVHADKIVVLEDGRIVERGDHGELLALRGKYYSLWRSQNPKAA
jgi:ABC-type multidrug transport system fused ATPase/permease subunit